MRYILNSEGYIYDIAFGTEIECDLGTCTLYTGEVPTGYSTLEEWLDGEIDKLNAWKIVEGNLVFDNAKYLELKELWEQQAEDNRPVYHKEIFEMKQQIEDISDISESQYQKAAATGKIITVDNVKKAYPKVKITDINPYSFSKVDLIATGKNQLKNEAVVQKIDGVNFTPNRDRSITIQGTTETTNKTATGTNVEITGGDLTSIDIYNNFVQKTRSGYNVYQATKSSYTEAGLTITNNGDGTYIVNGTATSDLSTALNDDFMPVSGTFRIVGCPSGGSSSTYMLSAYVGYWGGASPNIDIGNGTNITYTGNFKLRLYIKEGTVCNNLLFKPMVTYDLTKNYNDFEPYGASPSPDYPSEIETVKGRNICDVSTSQIGVAWNLSTNSARAICNVRVMPNTTYSLSFEDISGIDGMFFGQKVKATDTSVINGMTQITANRQITTTSTTNWLCIQFNKANISLNDIEAIKLQVEKGSAITNFVPYDNIQIINTDKNIEPNQSQTLNIDLKGNELCSIGDTKDVLSISVTGDTEINKKIGKVVLDGSENWQYSAQTNSVFYVQNLITDFARSNNIPLSNYYVGKTNVGNASAASNNGNNTISFNNYSSANYLYVVNNTYTSVNDFKTWLQEQYNNGTPVTVQYVLAEPETINLSPIEGLYLYEGTNCITNSENADMEVKYTISEKIEYNIAGTSSNTSAFLCFKKGINYYLSGLENQKIKMYYFDGTDRTEIYSGSGGTIKFTDSDKLVTQIVLITGGSSSKLTIYPMLVIGTAAAPYETYTSSMLSIDFKEYIEAGFFLGSNTFLGSNAFLKGTNINYILIEKNTIYVSVNNEEHKIGSGNVILFDGYDVLYTMQDTTLEVNYCINALEVDNLDFMRGKKTTTNKFKVLADGSIEAHDGNFSGTVTATAGKIGGCEISDGKLQVPSANISGTLSADKINGGTINASTISLEGVSLSPNASKLGGWSASSNRLYSNSSKVASSLYSNGNFILGGNYGMVKFDTNPVRITTADKLLISDSYSASEMANSNDTISIRAFSGTVHINSNYGVYAGSNRLDGSSSKAIKKNIKPIDPKYVDEIYKEVNKMPLYTYDYLDKYGDKDDFGFIIEDIENTCLNRTLKINKNPDDEKVKNYGTLELNKMNLLLIKELMKKNEELEKRIKELERKC